MVTSGSTVTAGSTATAGSTGSTVTAGSTGSTVTAGSTGSTAAAGSTGLALTDIVASPYPFLLAYPTPDAGTLAHRCTELQTLGVDQIYCAGATPLGGFSVVGRGYCGVVMLARWRGQLVALKVRRTHASQPSLAREALMLKRANQVQIGPQYLAHSPNFLVMSYIPGMPLLAWVTQRVMEGDRQRLKALLLQLLSQSFRLDQLGIDHGNLRCITGHSLVTADQAWLIDFSAASCDRRPANVTTLTQGLFLSTAIAAQVNPLFKADRAILIDRLRAYKHCRDRDRFQHLLTALFGRVI